VFGLPAGLAGVSLKRIVIAEKLTWSWRRALVVLAALAALGGVLSAPFAGGPVKFAPIDLASLLPVGLGFLAAFAWKHSERVEMTTAPNQGLLQSAQNAIRVGLFPMSASVLCGLLVGVWYNRELGLPPGDWSGLSRGLLFGLFIAPVVALPVGLYVGGSACLQHLALRFMLAVQGLVPWRLVRFLNCAADRILLRQVGGGYIFVHRLLLDYFVQRHERQEGG
jgi:hypothetical protein